MMKAHEKVKMKIFSSKESNEMSPTELVTLTILTNSQIIIIVTI